MHSTALSYEDRRGWAAQAACRHADPELFFPVTPAGPSLVQLARAKKVCARCPVRTPCLEFALETGQDFGVWGGASEQERRAMRRSRRRKSRAASRRR
jgi:WhiB family transcriptional regulator, redox-sensing transcriptional regulator